jgi:hypothetical protein
MLGEGQPRRPPASIWAQPGPPTDQFIAFERGVFGRRRDLRQGGKPLSRRDCQADQPAALNVGGRGPSAT